MTARRFVRETRAGATAIAAVVVAMMSIGGAALVTDHLWLVDGRDSLKSAIDAATLAATLELSGNAAVPDQELRRTAEQYILLNLAHLSPERFQTARDSLNSDEPGFLTVDRDAGTVEVVANARIGDTLVASSLPFLGRGGESQDVQVDAGVENVPNPVEVVLALDVSDSMDSCLDGTSCSRTPDEKRISIVRQAALDLVDILDPDGDNRVAVGLVPWHTEVRLDPAARAKWETNKWAEYPASRHYGATYRCAGDDLACTPPALTQVLPASAPEPWQGCLDEHRVNRIGRLAAPPPPSDLLKPPSTHPFAQAFYISSYMSAYACQAGPLPPEFSRQLCFDEVRDPGRQIVVAPQFRCPDQVPFVLPLTSERARMEDAIANLEPVGTRTHSGLGVLWGQRMLTHAWKDVWGHPVHPVDPALDDTTRKAIVLLTDGEDSHCGIGNYSCTASAVGISRDDACAAARAAGTEVFVIAAMDPALVSTSFEDDLRNCSSESDDPDGKYAFVNVSGRDELLAAFSDIAKQLMVVRRTR